MKIDKVIIASDSHVNYIDFWPYVYKAWAKMGIEPVLFYIGKKRNIFKSENVYFFDINSSMHSAFIAQNIRLLAPSMFLKDQVIISDIDSIPLSKSYFFSHIKKINEDCFVSYRTDDHCCKKGQIPICWNLAKGETWAEVFNLKAQTDWKSYFLSIMQSWYDDQYSLPKSGFAKNSWFIDQIKLKHYIGKWKLVEKNKNRHVQLKDVDTNFLRLDRVANNRWHTTNFSKDLNFSDFCPPRPFISNKDYILNILNQYGIK